MIPFETKQRDKSGFVHLFMYNIFTITVRLVQQLCFIKPNVLLTRVNNIYQRVSSSRLNLTTLCDQCVRGSRVEVMTFEERVVVCLDHMVHSSLKKCLAMFVRPIYHWLLVVTTSPDDRCNLLLTDKKPQIYRRVENKLFVLLTTSLRHLYIYIESFVHFKRSSLNFAHSR